METPPVKDLTSRQEWRFSKISASENSVFLLKNRNWMGFIAILIYLAILPNSPQLKQLVE
jgi:hypothetical protein